MEGRFYTLVFRRKRNRMESSERSSGPGGVSGSVPPSWVAQGLPRSLHSLYPPPSPPCLRLQQCICKSPRELWLPRHRLAGSQGWCSGSRTSQMGWQQGSVNPLGESSLANREKWLPALCPSRGAVEHGAPKSCGQPRCLHTLPTDPMGPAGP